MSIVCGFGFISIFEFLSKDGYARFQSRVINGLPAKKIVIFLCILLACEAFMSVFLGEIIEYNVELSTLFISYLFNQGYQLYQNLDGPEIYSVLYGPIMTLPASYVFKLGGWLSSARLIGVSGVAVFVIVSWHLVKWNKLRFEFMLWALVAVFYTLFFTFSTRMDSWLFALPMLGALGAYKRNLSIVAATAALAIGIKIVAIFYFIPLAIWVLMKEGLHLKKILFSGALFFLLTAAPFLMPGISADGYMFWIKAANEHPKNMASFVFHIVFTLVICMPAIVLLFKSKSDIGKYRDQVILLSAILVSGIILSYLSSKEGSSYYHIPPIVSAVLLLLISRDDWNSDFDFRILIISIAFMAPIVFATRSQYLTIAYLELTDGRPFKTGHQVLNEMKSYIDEKGSASLFSMGFGSPKIRHQNAGIHLLKLGGVYVLNEMALADWHASGIKIPEKTLNLFRDCKVPYWLIPAGEKPFHSILYSRGYIATPIEEIFDEKYHKEKSGKYFDLWTCK
jgi:hypothetical protein